MEARPQTVRVYETRDGARQFDNWLRSLRDSSARQRVRTRINRLRLGNFGDHKTVGDGVCELRIDYGPGYRVYCGRDGAEIVILLVGGDKRTQDRDIETAKEYWTDYKDRGSEDNHGTR